MLLFGSDSRFALSALLTSLTGVDSGLDGIVTEAVTSYYRLMSSPCTAERLTRAVAAIEREVRLDADYTCFAFPRHLRDGFLSRLFQLYEVRLLLLGLCARVRERVCVCVCVCVRARVCVVAALKESSIYAQGWLIPLPTSTLVGVDPGQELVFHDINQLIFVSLNGTGGGPTHGAGRSKGRDGGGAWTRPVLDLIREVHAVFGRLAGTFFLPSTFFFLSLQATTNLACAFYFIFILSRWSCVYECMHAFVVVTFCCWKKNVAMIRCPHLNLIGFLFVSTTTPSCGADSIPACADAQSFSREPLAALVEPVLFEWTAFAGGVLADRVDQVWRVMLAWVSWVDERVYFLTRN